jgi:transposase
MPAPSLHRRFCKCPLRPTWLSRSNFHQASCLPCQSRRLIACQAFYSESPEMLALHSQIKIYLHSQPIDMRKSFDGLFGIIKSDMGRDARDGGLFMFLNLRRNRIKLMYFETDGLVIWMKRLERGCFQRPLRSPDGKHVIIDVAELQSILSGIDLSSIKKRKRYVAPMSNNQNNEPKS